MENKFLSILYQILLVLLFISCGENPNLKKGKEFLDLGNYTKAIEFFNKAIEDDPQNIDAHLYLARTYEVINNKSEAYKAFMYAFKLDSTNSDLLLSFGSFLYRENLKREAYDLFYKLIDYSQQEKYIEPLSQITGVLPFKHKILAKKIQNKHEQDFSYVTYDRDILVYSTWLQGGGIGRSLIFLYDFEKDSLFRLSPYRNDVFESRSFVDFTNKRILYAIIDNHKNEICSIDFNGANQKTFVRTIIEDYSTDPGKIKCSPDGNTIIFTASAHESGNEFLYRINNTGNDFSPILLVSEQTFTWSSKIEFTFSPDSKNIAIFKPLFVDNQRYVDFHLYIYNLEKQSINPLINQSFRNPENLDFSQSGNFLAFISDNQLFIYNLEAKSIFSFPNTSKYTFSNKDDKIIFCKQDSIFVSKLNDANPRLISVINNASSNLLAVAKDGNSAIYNLDNNIIKIDLPTKVVEVNEFLEILNYLRN